jgi:predicted nucleotidyltransferase
MKEVATMTTESTEMARCIRLALTDITEKEGVRILLAVESGSRAWGFASPDSDYDVRFIYVRNMEFYLKLEKTKDVIEWQLDETLDISGWDLSKALRLLLSSNPTLFEWANSDTIYLETPEWERLYKIFPDYFQCRASMYHYLNMAENNYRTYLKGDMVSVKKYLYVLRSILCCQWIAKHESPPPMRFETLVAAQADAQILDDITDLLAMKKSAPETKEILKIETLNRYIEAQLPTLKEQVDKMDAPRRIGYEHLNDLFYSTLKGTAYHV